jgi:hypothetical protein
MRSIISVNPFARAAAAFAVGGLRGACRSPARGGAAACARLHGDYTLWPSSNTALGGVKLAEAFAIPEKRIMEPLLVSWRSLFFSSSVLKCPVAGEMARSPCDDSD